MTITVTSYLHIKILGYLLLSACTDKSVSGIKNLQDSMLWKYFQKNLTEM